MAIIQSQLYERIDTVSEVKFISKIFAMLSIVLFSICFFFVSSIAFDVHEEFTTFLQKHNKEYDLPELQMRLAVFRQNAKLVEELNSNPDDTAEYSLDGPFADMTRDEFRQILLPRSASPFAIEPLSATILSKPLPNSFDWTDQGAVTKVKDQGSLGTCWAFSAVGNIEGQYFLKTSKLIDLSVEQLVECDSSSEASRGIGDCGVFGGWPFLAFQYLERVGGIFSWDNFPYCASIGYGKPGSCSPCMAKGYSKDFCGDHSDLYCNSSTTLGQGQSSLCTASKGFETQVKGWRSFGSNETEIAQALVETGPLSVALDADMLQFYSKGVYNPWFCDPTSLNHAVLLVGFGSEGAHEFWKVKNSWGPSWGEEGYFRIARGKGKCGINTQVSTAKL